MVSGLSLRLAGCAGLDLGCGLSFIAGRFQMVVFRELGSLKKRFHAVEIPMFRLPLFSLSFRSPFLSQ